MAALATPISADRCLELGLANRAVEDDQVLQEARTLAKALVEQSAQALSATKRGLREAAQRSLNDTMQLEGELQDQCKASEEFQARLAAFRQSRRK
jgi:2-(1,2-epoxy-1,2-dihydrophenyl)acetyl-CoA isomerase